MNVLKKQNHKATDLRAKKLFDQTYEWTNKCVQCGYCLPACPTYDSMGKESASPRGRINLVKMAAEGKVDIRENLAGPIDLCLGCRACETACPVGVPYGHILEAAKEVMEESKPMTQANFVKNFVLNHLIPYPNRMKMLGNSVWLYQKSRLNKLVRKMKIIDKISRPFAEFEKALPELESPLKRVRRGVTFPAKGKKKAKVAFFAGCVMESIMSRINRLSIELLTSIGCEVIVPKQQNCCGALHAHQGAKQKAKELAKANICAFEESGADFLVNNAGGCGAALVEYDSLLADEEEWKDRAKEFVKKARDISQILLQYGSLSFKREWNGIVVYQDSCHLRNVQGVYKEPRLLLQSIPKAQLKELDGADRCCASGGIYNLLHFHESMNILDEKMKRVKQTNAMAVITANPGCQLQMSLGIQRHGSRDQMRSMHLVEILAEACGFD
jgi:glycolate oxidase iron-sulfur subunit